MTVACLWRAVARQPLAQRREDAVGPLQVMDRERARATPQGQAAVARSVRPSATQASRANHW